MMERARLIGVALAASLALAGCHSPTKPDDPNHGIPLEGVPHNSSRDPLPLKKYIVTGDGVQTRMWVEFQEITIIQVQPVPEFAAMNCDGDCLELSFRVGIDNQAPEEAAGFIFTLKDSAGQIGGLPGSSVGVGIEGEVSQRLKQHYSLHGMRPVAIVVTSTKYGAHPLPVGTVEFDMVHY